MVIKLSEIKDTPVAQYNDDANKTLKLTKWTLRFEVTG